MIVRPQGFTQCTLVYSPDCIVNIALFTRKLKRAHLNSTVISLSYPLLYGTSAESIYGGKNCSEAF